MEVKSVDVLVDLFDPKVERSAAAYHDVLVETLREQTSPALVYFYSLWCEDCRGNEEQFNELLAVIRSDWRKPTPVIKCPVGVGKYQDWKLPDGKPDFKNPFRNAPLWIEEIPAAAVLRYEPKTGLVVANGTRIFGQGQPTSENLFKLYDIVRSLGR